MWAGGSGRSGRRSLGASQQWPRVSTSWSGSGGRLTLRSREALRRSRQSSSERPSAQVGQGGLELLRPDVEEAVRSEEHTSELQSLMRISYAVFCLKKKKKKSLQNMKHYIQ